MKKPILCLIFLLLSYTASQACTCVENGHPTLKETITTAFKDSAAVFAARVTDVFNNEHDNGYIAKLKVSEIWKGSDITDLTFKIGTDGCAFHFEKGRKYLIFALEENGLLKIASCSQSRRF